jgi:hypothetical protein
VITVAQWAPDLHDALQEPRTKAQATVSAVEPGSVHDLTAARHQALGALSNDSDAALLADNPAG